MFSIRKAVSVDVVVEAMKCPIVDHLTFQWGAIFDSQHTTFRKLIRKINMNMNATQIVV
jgi:hypothetical protein